MKKWGDLDYQTRRDCAFLAIGSVMMGGAMLFVMGFAEIANILTGGAAREPDLWAGVFNLCVGVGFVGVAWLMLAKLAIIAQRQPEGKEE